MDISRATDAALLHIGSRWYVDSREDNFSSFLNKGNSESVS